ncbi:hypothetical protein TNCV_4729281 [Trichonephila clavipes]|nr:hypothetical protein TNCV_4729281 [Trichonephila clavipes]
MGVPKLDRPSQSPDLNRIDHLWDVLDRRIRSQKNQPSSLQVLISVVMDAWKAIPLDALSPYQWVSGYFWPDSVQPLPCEYGMNGLMMSILNSIIDTDDESGALNDKEEYRSGAMSSFQTRFDSPCSTQMVISNRRDCLSPACIRYRY